MRLCLGESIVVISDHSTNSSLTVDNLWPCICRFMSPLRPEYPPKLGQSTAVLMSVLDRRDSTGCPKDSTQMFRKDGLSRCACDVGLRCVGPSCILGSAAVDGSQIQGYPPSCGSCHCSSGPGNSNNVSMPSVESQHTPNRGETATEEIKATEHSPNEENILRRRECAQTALYGALGFDYNEEYFVMGCNSEAIWDFDNWAKRTG